MIRLDKITKIYDAKVENKKVYTITLVLIFSF